MRQCGEDRAASNGAGATRLNRLSFAPFRREQLNAITRSQYHTPRGVAALKKHGLPAARIPMAGGCSGYARYRFVAADRERVHALWSADHPRYWVPQTDTERDAADALVYNRPMLSDHPDAVPRPRYGYMWGLNVEIANHGLARRHPVPWKGERPPVPSYYPDIGGWVARPWPTDPVARAEELLRKGPRVGASIDFRGGITRGFAYCYPYPEKFQTGVTYPDPWTAPGGRLLQNTPNELRRSIIGRPFATAGARSRSSAHCRA